MPTRRKAIQYAIAVVVVAVAPAAFAQPEPLPDSSGDIAAVQACVNANLPRKTTVANVEIESFDASGGSQRLKARIWGRTDDSGRKNLNLRVDGPPDLAGAGYLVLEREGRDDVYMYIPALNKTRRMTGDTAAASLWGSDFSYADVQQLRGISGDGALTLLADSEVAGRPVRVVQLMLDPVEESPYERIEFRVDRETCVPLQIAFMEPGNKPRKLLIIAYDALIRVEERWVPTRYEMTDLRDETRTIMTVSDPRFDSSLSGRVFNPRLFQLGGD